MYVYMYTHYIHTNIAQPGLVQQEPREGLTAAAGAGAPLPRPKPTESNDGTSGVVKNGGTNAISMVGNGTLMVKHGGKML